MPESFLISRFSAIKEFFDCTLQDLKALTKADIDELAGPCAVALGKVLKTS
jgi:hypothetical protein